MTSKVNIAGLNLSEADIERMKAGEPISGSLSGGIGGAAEVVSPRQTHQLRGYGTNIRPRISGNDPNEGLIDGLGDDFGRKLGDKAIQQRNEDRERQQEEAKQKDTLKPESLKRDLSATQRAVKRLEKAVREMQKALEAKGDATT